MCRGCIILLSSIVMVAKFAFCKALLLQHHRHRDATKRLPDERTHARAVAARGISSRLVDSGAGADVVENVVENVQRDHLARRQNRRQISANEEKAECCAL